MSFFDGMFGRIERDVERWAPTLENYLRRNPRHHPGPVPAPRPTPGPEPVTGLEVVTDADDVDRASEVTGWPMYCNGPDSGNPKASPDGLGDCTIAAMAHGLTAMNVFAGKPQVLFNDKQIVTAYAAISGYDPKTGENDNGCQMQDVLKYMMETGMADAKGTTHKIVSFAAFGDPTDVGLMAAALKTFGFVYVGINCPASAQEQFGQVWTYVPGSEIVGGHAIGHHRRKPVADNGPYDFSSWGAQQWADKSFIANYSMEAWVFTTPDWIEANGNDCDGVALAQLESDMKFV